MKGIKLKHSQVETVRVKLMVGQAQRCLLCGEKFGLKGKKPALDHDHKSGYIRQVLCLWCNGMLGKVENASQRAVGKKGDLLPWLELVVAYLKDHKIPHWSLAGVRRGLIPPTFKTAEDKRLVRLATAKRRRSTAAAMRKVK